MTLAMLGLAGIPGTVGFIGKFQPDPRAGGRRLRLARDRPGGRRDDLARLLPEGRGRGLDVAGHHESAEISGVPAAGGPHHLAASPRWPAAHLRPTMLPLPRGRPRRAPSSALSDDRVRGRSRRPVFHLAAHAATARSARLL